MRFEYNFCWMCKYIFFFIIICLSNIGVGPKGVRIGGSYQPTLQSVGSMRKMPILVQACCLRYVKTPQISKCRFNKPLNWIKTNYCNCLVLYFWLISISGNLNTLLKLISGEYESPSFAQTQRQKQWKMVVKMEKKIIGPTINDVKIELLSATCTTFFKHW